MVVTAFFYFVHELSFLFFLFILGLFFILRASSGLTVTLFISSDSFSFYLFLLTLLVFIACILSVFYEKLNYSFWLYLNFLLFILVLFLLFLFFSSNMFFFYVFFELTVIPTFIIIIGWGYRINRLQASFYIVIYMLFSSFPFLLSFIFYFGSGLSFSFLFRFHRPLVLLGSFWWFLLFSVFAVKLPVFFLHLWLPKAHVDAPLLGSMVLAGVLLKMGGFGLLRVSLLFFSLYLKFGWLIACFSLVGSFYSAIICLRQIDIKSLVAYSSIVHMGPVLRCFFLISYYRVLGSFLLIYSHGLCSCALFFLLNFFRKLLFTRRIFFLRGSIFVSGLFSFFWFSFCFLNIGCPPSFNFFSELLTVFPCFFYSHSLIMVFFFIMTTVGFYCVVLLVGLGHGSSLPSFIPCFIFLKLSDLLTSFILAVFLFIFVFYTFILSC